MDLKHLDLKKCLFNLHTFGQENAITFKIRGFHPVFFNTPIKKTEFKNHRNEKNPHCTTQKIHKSKNVYF